MVETRSVAYVFKCMIWEIHPVSTVSCCAESLVKSFLSNLIWKSLSFEMVVLIYFHTQISSNLNIPYCVR